MKKVLAVILAVIMLTSIAGTAYAENPPNNPFAVQPTVINVMSLDKTIPGALKNGRSIFQGPDNTVWIVTQNTDANVHLLQVDASGKVVKDVILKGYVPINDYYVFNKDNYLYVETVQDVNSKDIYSLYCFDLEKGEITWEKEWNSSVNITLVPSGFVYRIDKKFIYVDDTGKTIFTLDEMYDYSHSSKNNFVYKYFASNSKNNSMLVKKITYDIDYTDATHFGITVVEEKMLELSLVEGKILNTYDLPIIMEGNTRFIYSSVIQSDAIVDLSKTDVIPVRFSTWDKSSPYYNDKILVADLHFDGTKFTVENKATYTPNKADGIKSKWDTLYFANDPRNYILYDTNGYRIFMDSPFYHYLKQNIEVHDLNNNLLWSKTTYSTKTIWNGNSPVVYKDMIVYGDEGKIVFANLSDGKIRYSIPLDETTETTVLCPIGVVGNDFWYGLWTEDTITTKTSFYKITFPPTGTITIKSNIPSAGFTITSGDKSMKWTTGKPVELPAGTYTITMDTPTIDGVKTPDPVQVTVEDGVDKSVEMDYVDTKAPDVTVDNPVVNGNTATINGTVTDNLSGIKEVSINGTAVTVSDGKFTTNLPITNGILSFTISATDNAGNTTGKSFKYDYLSPEVSFTVSNPTIYKATNTATFIVNGNAIDNDAIYTVTVNDTIVPVVNGKFSITLNTTYSPGSDYTITIIATDKSGNKTTKTYNYTFKSITEIILKINDKNFKVNGETKTLDAPPIIKNGRTLLPIRPIVEALGGSVSWDGTERKVTVSLGSTTIELWIGKNTARVNGTNTPIDATNSKVVPEIINGRTMLPLRFVTENLGCQLQWDPNTKTITITYQG